MEPDAYDWSWARMPAAVAKKHGAKAVMAYLSWDTSKNMTSAEIKAHHQQGLGVVLGWESTEGRALGGAANGTQDGQGALAQMKTHVANLGYAPKVPVAVPFAVDQDVSPSQFGTILAYLRAAQKVFDADTKTIRLVASVYGEYDLIEFVAKNGIGKGLFQTYAWSGGQLSSHTALYQFLNGQTVDGFSVDYDRVTNIHALAAWWPPNHPLNQPPTPKDWFDMATKQELSDLIDERLAHLFAGPFGNSWKPFDLAATSRLKLALIKRSAAKRAKKGGK